MRPPIRAILWTTLLSVCLLAALPASAFCGFYVSGAGARLYNNASMVVLMRAGERTVLSMQNDYQGPPEDFALVVPVPVVLDEDSVKTLEPDVFDRIDRLAAPRLVEYWEQDPCAPVVEEEAVALKLANPGAAAADDLGVRVEAEFKVGEYDIVILSAEDSSGLDTWLREREYKIPPGADAALRPYVFQGMKFFVAKVDTDRVRFEDGRAMLSPLRFHFDSEKFMLPIRLGLLNARGEQDLIVHILGDTRYEAANFENVTIPTNLDVKDETRERFAEFYAALFDQTLNENPGSVVTEYAWSSASCDPCPVPPLGPSELATLGADVIGQQGDEPARAAPERSRATQTGAPEAPAAEASSVTVRVEAVQVVGGEVPGASAAVEGLLGPFRRCYVQGLARSPRDRATVKFGIILRADGKVGGVAAEPRGRLDKITLACIRARAREATFEVSEGEQPVVQFELGLSPPPPGETAAAEPTDRLEAAPVPEPESPAPAPPALDPQKPFVLTRLHIRYDEGSMHQDLVFRPAEPISGGREVYGDDVLEHGASPSHVNGFQARYAIRHPYDGPIDCDDPQRGLWGGPPADVNRRTGPEAATGLAYAPRGAISPARFLVRQGIIDPAGDKSREAPFAAVTEAAPAGHDDGPEAPERRRTLLWGLGLVLIVLILWQVAVDTRERKSS